MDNLPRDNSSLNSSFLGQARFKMVNGVQNQTRYLKAHGQNILTGGARSGHYAAWPKSKGLGLIWLNCMLPKVKALVGLFESFAYSGHRTAQDKYAHDWHAWCPMTGTVLSGLLQLHELRPVVVLGTSYKTWALFQEISQVKHQLVLSIKRYVYLPG